MIPHAPTFVPRNAHSHVILNLFASNEGLTTLNNWTSCSSQSPSLAGLRGSSLTTKPGDPRQPFACCHQKFIQINCKAATRAACISTCWPGEQVNRTSSDSTHSSLTTNRSSPNHLALNQALTHAAAKQLNQVPFQAPLVAARGAREGLWSE